MYVIKKSAIATLIFSASSVFAHTAYYGSGFGIGQNTSSVHTTYTTGSTQAITGGSSLQRFYFIGGQRQLSEIYTLSIQMDLGYDNLSNTVASAGTEIVKIKSEFHCGLSARAGIIRGDYAPYFVAGLRIDEWSLSVENFGNSDTYGVIPAIASANVLGEKTLIAPELGVGIHFTLSDKIDGRMEYKYFFGGNITQVDSTSTNTYTLQARQQSVQFSWIR